MSRNRYPWFLIGLLWSSKAFGQDFTSNPPGDDKIEPVSKGEAVPFSGQLFDTNTALRWGNYLEQCRVRLKVDVQWQQQLGQVEVNQWKTKYELVQRHNETIERYYQEENLRLRQELESPPFYRTPWFGVTVGVVGTVLAVSATAWLVSSVH
jgi:hypothetical protein